MVEVLCVQARGYGFDGGVAVMLSVLLFLRHVVYVVTCGVCCGKKAEMKKQPQTNSTNTSRQGTNDFFAASIDAHR